MHSVHSDGELTPEQLVTAAGSAGLDFIATTEHNTAAAHHAWDLPTEAGLLVITGEEVTTRTGHWLALGIPPGEVIDWRYGAEDSVIGQHLGQVHAAGGLGVVAHPHAPCPTGTFLFPFDGFDVVEVWNGLWTSDLPWNADNEAGLADWARELAQDMDKGGWRPAMGNSDTHLEGQIGLPHTVVLAEELSTDAVLAGIRSGRSWIAESSDVDLSFFASVDGDRAEIGEQLQSREKAAIINFHVRGVLGGVVSFQTDSGEHHGETFAGPEHATTWGITAGEARFVRCEVRRSDGSMAALTNPILLV